MAIKKKSFKNTPEQVTSESVLEKTAEENTRVTIGTSKEQTPLKNGIPNDHSVKHLGQTPIVGISIGSTLNMENYESLRVDCWLTDTVHDGETFEEAYNRIRCIAENTLQETIKAYTE